MDRHIHCVYYKHNYENKNSLEGKCLLKQKEINDGFAPHCQDYVLRPAGILAYYLKHEGICEDWICADEKALEYVDRMGFNNRPKTEDIDELNQKKKMDWMKIDYDNEFVDYLIFDEFLDFLKKKKRGELDK